MHVGMTTEENKLMSTYPVLYLALANYFLAASHKIKVNLALDASYV